MDSEATQAVYRAKYMDELKNRLKSILRGSGVVLDAETADAFIESIGEAADDGSAQ